MKSVPKDPRLQAMGDGVSALALILLNLHANMLSIRLPGRRRSFAHRLRNRPDIIAEHCRIPMILRCGCVWRCLGMLLRLKAFAYARVHSNNQSATVAGVMHWNREFEAGFRSFFENDGRDMPQAKQYLAAACDCLTKRAYWSAWSNLVRREEGSVSLMAFALRRHPLMALMPPFDYLFQRRRRLSP